MYFISFNLICNITIFWKKVDFILAYMWPLQRGHFGPMDIILNSVDVHSLYRWCYIPNIKHICLAVSVKKIFSCFPFIRQCKICDPQGGPIFWPHGYIWTNLWESVIVLCFVVRYFMFILVLQSSWWGRESWLLCLICLPGVSWWLSGFSLRCHGVVCSLWLWYFLINLTYYFLVEVY